MKQLCALLRPSYKTNLQIVIETSGESLQNVFDKECRQCVQELQGESVCMTIDGWSNIRNEPIICVCVVKQGKVFLVDTVSTSSNSHTSDYLKTLSVKTI